MTTSDLTHPILNSPFDFPTRHFEIGSEGPTGEIRDGRRSSQSFIPVPQRGDEQRAQSTR